MTHPTLPCPLCGTEVVGARSFASGRGLLLEARDGLVSGYVLDAARTASYSGRRPEYAPHGCPPGWDVVVTVLRGEASVCAVDEAAAKTVRRALAGRTSGPVARLPAVLERLAGAGLRAFRPGTPEEV